MSLEVSGSQPFRRAFVVTEQVDTSAISSKLELGVLTIRLPHKRKDPVKGRAIAIEDEEDSSSEALVAAQPGREPTDEKATLPEPIQNLLATTSAPAVETGDESWVKTGPTADELAEDKAPAKAASEPAPV